jgi:hypothetical protein
MKSRKIQRPGQSQGGNQKGNGNNDATKELRDSSSKIVKSVVNMSKNVNWKSVLPKVALGMVVLYGLRNRKMLSGLVTSTAFGMLTKDYADKMGGKLTEVLSSGKLGDTFKQYAQQYAKAM